MKLEGNWIKAASAHAGMSLTDLSSRLGLSRATLYAYVSGALIPSTERLKEIADITQFPLELNNSRTPEPVQGTVKVTTPELISAMLKAADPLAVVSLIEKSPQSTLELNGDILLELGNALTLAGYYQDAVFWTRKAKEAFKESGATHSEGRCCQTLGFCFTNTGPLSRARDYFDEAYKLLEPGSRWKPQVAKAAIQNRLGLYDPAIEIVDNILKNEKDDYARLYAKGVKAAIYAHFGKWADALEMETEAFEDAIQLQSNDQICERLVMMLNAAIRSNSPRINEIASLCKGFFLAYQDRARHAMYQSTLSLEALRRDDLVSAQVHADRAIDLSIRGQFRRAELSATLRLAEISLLRGNEDGCIAHANRAIAYAETNEYTIGDGYGRMLAALVLLSRGDFEEAQKHADIVASTHIPEGPKIITSLLDIFDDLKRDGKPTVCMIARQLRERGVIVSI